MWFLDSLKLKSTVWSISSNRIQMGSAFLSSNPKLTEMKTNLPEGESAWAFPVDVCPYFLFIFFFCDSFTFHLLLQGGQLKVTNESSENC